MVPGRELAYFYLWPDSGGRLQEGMACGAEKIREYSMEEDGVSGSEDVREVCAIQKSCQCIQDPFRVKDEPFPYPVVGTLGDAEMLAEARNVFELSGDPGIEEGNKESQAV